MRASVPAERSQRQYPLHLPSRRPQPRHVGTGAATSRVGCRRASLPGRLYPLPATTPQSANSADTQPFIRTQTRRQHPVDILQQQAEWLAARQRLEEPPRCCLQRALVGRGCRTVGLRVHADQEGEKTGGVRSLWLLLGIGPGWPSTVLVTSCSRRSRRCPGGTTAWLDGYRRLPRPTAR